MHELTYKLEKYSVISFRTIRLNFEGLNFHLRTHTPHLVLAGLAVAVVVEQGLQRLETVHPPTAEGHSDRTTTPL